MRFRILVIMMLALWIPLAGHAELAIDLSTATLEELLAARDAIQARIEEIEKEAAEARISVGVYKIGEDLEPGIYVLMEEDDALLPSFILRDAETEETLEFEIISNQMVVMLEKGQIMHLSEARVYPIAEAPIAAVTSEAPLCEGGYLVGTQLAAGKYRIVPDEGAIFACFAVYDGPVSRESRILKFMMLYEAADVELADGQYIVISDCVMTVPEA